MQVVLRGIGALGVCLVVGATAGCSHPAAGAANPWNPKAAAAYLDGREAWWMQWTGSARDHGTVCVSCHTNLPYILARPALRGALYESGPSVNEQRLIDDVIRRVRLGRDAGPYYSEEGYDHKTAESRGTEAVLNALILASFDAQSGRLSDDTRAALGTMWGLQRQDGDNKGSWAWLQFDLEPWEASDSPYYGAALAALAVGTAPGNYAASAGIQPHLALLRDYLNRKSAAQSTLNRVFLLWASARLPGLLTPERKQAIVQEILDQQQADGGWRLASIATSWKSSSLRSLVKTWFRADGTPLKGTSDGAATGLVTLALEEAGLPSDNVRLNRGLWWLANNQNTGEGFWTASSLNQRRKPDSGIGRFMSDAATAYAVLALSESQSARSTNPAAGSVARLKINESRSR